ncbi:deoxyribodipyrimidine photo-lyase [Serratia entomophila]|uniref:deoxyribodipyrimidine photo-lyase n=1 Tax=Serratia entomophila TaxID=42906 RepID=UPI00217C4893|nr:deoxyribodipyrimidine photo-lyase [Serratia entomophila]CAI0812937.1 Deoxyribodipyrimidine photo-lyase [Serratia entomophila]CAI1548973.1 Deoxyribodipyrimidine photo-lyase [Serratia entomophila]CAI1558621.1 Deoxyribodipyrimidine photo-lyase [Serratia entomophila]CAI1626800.1 Deoxyribodipyrimidine photo-lyase [Serratia entomophila]CAI1671952.1 Deoxyribodipyrimidine photo-lyase [Serratia entomophila]
MTTHLVWLRNDLRITDNRALHAACSDPTARVLAVFIATPQQWRRHEMAPRQAALLHASLRAVQQALAQKGVALHCHSCADFAASIDWLAEYCRREQVDALFYNRQYELNERRRDAQLEQRLSGRVMCRSFDDSLLLPPGSVQTGGGEMYKVYTPFRNAFIQRLAEFDVSCLPAPKIRAGGALPVPEAPAAFDYPAADIGDDYPAGEEAALQRLRAFSRERVQDYLRQRDLPAIAGTSGLSPYLAIGVLSPRQCFNRLRAEHPSVLEAPESGAFGWLNELIWREFYRHLLVAYPALCKHRPFIAWTDKVRWRNDPSLLQAWQRGETGYPIVDAAMRQLNETGWMHNRLRMISASFLVKDLLIDWRAGERYFMSQLLDGDLAANNGGWQWAASTGTDAAPYFRIFNPTTQGERFDPQGTFIRKWLPELADVPDNDIHHPHRWAEKQRRALNYPLPVVDHRQARLETLAAFEAAKRGGS